MTNNTLCLFALLGVGLMLGCDPSVIAGSGVLDSSTLDAGASGVGVGSGLDARAAAPAPDTSSDGTLPHPTSASDAHGAGAIDGGPLGRTPDLGTPDLGAPDLGAPDLGAPDLGFTPQPAVVWAQQLGGTRTVLVRDVAVDARGNVIVVGLFYGAALFGGTGLISAGGSDMFVASFDSAGNKRWVKRYGSTWYDRATCVAVDSDDNVVVGGSFHSSVDFGGGALTSDGDIDVVLFSLSAAGSFRWAKRFGGDLADAPSDIAIDSSDAIVLSATFRDKADFGGTTLTSAGESDMALASYTADGLHRWSKRFGGSSHVSGGTLALDQAGRIFLAGMFMGKADFGGSTLNALGSDLYLASYDRSGAHRWSKRFGGSSDDGPGDIALDPAGNIVVTGRFLYSINLGGSPLSSNGRTDVFVASFDDSGTHRWSHSFGGNASDYSYGVVVDQGGNAIVTGIFERSGTFGGVPLTSNGGMDIFVASFDSTGDHRWVWTFGGPGTDRSAAAALDAGGDLVVGGDFRSAVDLGQSRLTSLGVEDGLLVKLSPP